MSAKLVFQAALRGRSGEIRNIALSIDRDRDWPRLGVTDGVAGFWRELASCVCHELNALLHAGFPLEALAAAGRLSASNHAEIARRAFEAVAAANAALRSASLKEFC